MSEKYKTHLNGTFFVTLTVSYFLLLPALSKTRLKTQALVLFARLSLFALETDVEGLKQIDSQTSGFAILYQ